MGVRENRKFEFTAHQEACFSVGIKFISIVVETFGGWCEDPINSIIPSIKAIGHQLGQMMGSSPADVFFRGLQSTSQNLRYNLFCFILGGFSLFVLLHIYHRVTVYRA